MSVYYNVCTCKIGLCKGMNLYLQLHGADQMIIKIYIHMHKHALCELEHIIINNIMHTCRYTYVCIEHGQTKFENSNVSDPTWPQFLHICIQICVHTRVHTHTYALAHTCEQTNTNIHKHNHRHTDKKAHAHTYIRMLLTFRLTRFIDFIKF